MYAILSVPYLIILIIYWVPDGNAFNYSAPLIIGFGGLPAALMKSGCTITTLIAIDRIVALFFPMKYYTLQRRRYLIGGFILSMLMAAFDWAMLFMVSSIEPSPGCSSFACFTSGTFRAYWGLSNTIVNMISCLLTIGVVFGLRRLRWGRSKRVAQERRQLDDKAANRAAVLIITVSAVFGVVPGIINACGEFLNLEIFNEIGFFIGVCASISGLSHAFIFGMAHRGMRMHILEMFGFKVADQTRISSVRSMAQQQSVFQKTRGKTVVASRVGR
ncbi:hypothetical protein Tcan_17293 [Toxocara canis]|uniref:G_PROTEIN_RECEP_F1_2 domain-containing protein n=1 Tax=Toxocara canis TaxID=6265 RepID=A0A0B2VEX6_TOXCA|nr:hypothetical protein Tcan_17293 [Toxocara canis]